MWPLNMNTIKMNTVTNSKKALDTNVNNILKVEYREVYQRLGNGYGSLLYIEMS